VDNLCKTRRNLQRLPVLALQATALLTLLTLLCFLNACQQPKPTGVLQIFYTGNLTGNFQPCACGIPKGGLARRLAFMNQHRIEGAQELRVDIGNFADLKEETGEIATDCIARGFELLDYHAVNVSRQEMSLDPAYLAQSASDHHLHLVSANIIDSPTGKLMFEPYRIVRYPGLKVACLGLTYERFYRFSRRPNQDLFQVQPLMEAANTWIPNAKRKCDLLIVLTDLGYPDVDTLIAHFPQIDVILTTASNPSFNPDAKRHGVIVAESHFRGYDGTVVNIDFDKSSGDSLVHGFIGETLTNAFQADSTMLELERDCADSINRITSSSDSLVAEAR
jgi:2',3'-cyclic-nucleotide 2'-phosphodiesterase (5'-nucleotidase family)